MKKINITISLLLLSCFTAFAATQTFQDYINSRPIANQTRLKNLKLIGTQDGTIVLQNWSGSGNGSNDSVVIDTSSIPFKRLSTGFRVVVTNKTPSVFSDNDKIIFWNNITGAWLTTTFGAIRSGLNTQSQINADWNSTSGVSQILNKPALGAAATSNNYNDLNNKPVLGTAASKNVSDFDAAGAAAAAAANSLSLHATADNAAAVNGVAGLTVVNGANAGSSAVQPTRKINNKALSSDIVLTPSDIGSPSGSGTSNGINTGDETQSTIKSKLGNASATNDGYLSKDDWNTFNNKLSTSGTAYNTDRVNNVTASDVVNNAASGAAFASNSSSYLKKNGDGSNLVNITPEQIGAVNLANQKAFNVLDYGASGLSDITATVNSWNSSTNISVNSYSTFKCGQNIVIDRAASLETTGDVNGTTTISNVANTSIFNVGDYVRVINGRPPQVLERGITVKVLGNVGDIISTRINGIAYTYTIQTGDTISLAAVGLANAITDASVTATANNGVITIAANVAGTSFTFENIRPVGRSKLIYSTIQPNIPLGDFITKIVTVNSNSLVVSVAVPANLTQTRIEHDNSRFNTSILSCGTNVIGKACNSTNWVLSNSVANQINNVTIYHNEQPSFIAARDAAIASNGFVYVPTGTYLLATSQTVLNMKDVSLVGDGKAKSIIKSLPTRNSNLIAWSNNTSTIANGFGNVTVKGLTFNLQDSWYNYVLISQNSRLGVGLQFGNYDNQTRNFNIELDHVEISNTPNVATNLYNVDGAYIHDSYLHDIGDNGFHIGMYFPNTGKQDTQLKDIFVTNNIFERIQWIGVNIYGDWNNIYRLGGFRHVHINNNSFRNMGIAGLELYTGTEQAEVLGNTFEYIGQDQSIYYGSLYVAGNGKTNWSTWNSSSINWNSSTNYNQNDVVYYSGAYYIAFANSTNQAPYNNVSYWLPIVDRKHGALVVKYSSYVTSAHNTISNSYNGVEIFSRATNLTTGYQISRDLKIDNNIVTDSSNQSIAVSGDTENLVIENNTCDGAGSAGIQVGGLNSDSYGVMSYRTTVKNNRINDSVWGIYVAVKNQNVLVKNNEIYNSNAYEENVSNRSAIVVNLYDTNAHNITGVVIENNKTIEDRTGNTYKQNYSIYADNIDANTITLNQNFASGNSYDNYVLGSNATGAIIKSISNTWDLGGYLGPPIASGSQLGGIKVGNNLSIDSNGILSAANSSGIPYTGANQAIDLNNQNVSGIGTLAVKGPLTVYPGSSAYGELDIDSRTADNYSGVGLALRKQGSASGATASVASGSTGSPLSWYFWDGSSWGIGAQFYAFTREAWGTSAHGARLVSSVVKNGTTTLTPWLYVDQNGNAGIGNNPSLSAPATTLHIFDRTPTTGSSYLMIQAGAGQSTNTMLGVFSNDLSSYYLQLTPSYAKSVLSWRIGDTTAPTEKLEVAGNILATTNIIATNQLKSNVSSGTAPLVVNSGTQVANLNCSFLESYNWAVPGHIGLTTANDGHFTTLYSSNQYTNTLANGTAPFVVTSQTKVVNLNVDMLDGKHDTDFLAATGTAADSSKLNGQLASYYSANIASGTVDLGTGSIASGACSSVISSANASILSTDVIEWTPNANMLDPTNGINGYKISVNGSLVIQNFVSTGYVNFQVCNGTNASINRDSVTINWKVKR